MRFLCVWSPLAVTEVETLLASAAIPTHWERLPAVGRRGAIFVLSIVPAHADAVAFLLAQGSREARQRAGTPPVSRPAPGHLLLHPPFAFGLVFAALLAVFYAVTGGISTHSEWFRRGALVIDSSTEVELFRVVTAATLHADGAHLLGNAVFVWLLFWAVGERVGIGMALGAWLVCAVAGFVPGLLFDARLLTVGASGGLFGLLGAAAGHGLRTAPLMRHWYRPRMRALGAALALLALTAFSPKANLKAHLTGFGVGLAIGFFVRAPRTGLSQALIGVGSGVCVLGAWLAAWGRL